MELPIGCHEFDIVLFTLSLHHHPNVPVALKEAKRVLKPNGYVLVIEPTPESEIQRLCKPFEDEDDKLLAVEQALPRCCLEIISQKTFQTQWVFDDYEDVVNYPFAYYQHPHDEDKRSALLAFLGSKVQTKPIHMTDTLRLTCLRPSNRVV